MTHRNTIEEVIETAKTYIGLAEKFVSEGDAKTARLLIAYGVTLAEGTREVRQAVNAIRTDAAKAHQRPVADLLEGNPI